MKSKFPKASSWQRLFVTILRACIGWHLFYEGLAKWMNPDWTATSYLANSTGFLAGFYGMLASHPGWMSVIDFLNIYGLLLIGVGLFLGFFTRIASAAGALLLGLYFLAYPPFGSSAFMSPEGHLYLVNTTLIETVILVAFIFMRDRGYGVDRMLELRKLHGNTAPAPVRSGRREVLKDLAAVPLLGLTSYAAVNRLKKYGQDGITGATIQVGALDLSELKGNLPKGKLGNMEMGRLVLGGNLIGGWTHSRDLLYVSSLSKAYNTERKIFETLMLCEQAGIDAINIGFKSNPVLAKYKKVTGSKIKVISQVHPDMDNNDWY
ncbi:MAG: DoxX family protein, partial [Verrucomicrobiae bacterium]|nr:DoxX family protein [Verrucomicrobiae bacterium]